MRGEPRKRILIVDDDRDLGAGLTVAFENQGYEVCAAADGAEALATAAEFRPDLVILDVMMPEVDGWQVLARLRANPITSKVAVIMLTAADTEEATLKGLALGADDYVTKPFSIQELRYRAAAVLRRTSTGPAGDAATCLPVLGDDLRTELVDPRDVYYVEGVHNYSYVHTVDRRYLSRLGLGEIEARSFEGFARVHRSYVVNLQHVVGYFWANKSSYRLRLGDLAGTEIPVGRTMTAEVRRRLGLAR